MSLLSPEMVEMDHKMRAEVIKGGMSSPEFLEISNTKLKLFKKHGVKQWASVLNILSIPIYLSWFFTVRELLNKNDLILQNSIDSSFYWIANISEVDPYAIIPLTTALVTFVNILKLVKMSEKNPALNPQMREIFGYLKFVPFISIPFMSMLPSGLHAYFIAVGLSNFFITSFMESKYFIKLAKIPDAFPGTVKWHEMQEKTKIDAELPDTDKIIELDRKNDGLNEEKK